MYPVTDLVILSPHSRLRNISMKHYSVRLLPLLSLLLLAGLSAEEDNQSESALKFVPLTTSTPLAGTGIGGSCLNGVQTKYRYQAF